MTRAQQPARLAVVRGLARGRAARRRPRCCATPDGAPAALDRLTAHLADDERLFVTALLLDKVKTWMRRQGGTTALRALVYMDEIFGYFPPHPANPPTKRPLLTLLKQARAQGVGVVLATQNPVDLDYKGLANMGTWLVGHAADRAGPRAAARTASRAPGSTRGRCEQLLDATRKRVFLLHDVHRKRPELARTRAGRCPTCAARSRATRSRGS